MAKYCRMKVPPRESQQNNNCHRHGPQKKKNKSLWAKLKRKEETQNSNSAELEHMISNLKIQVEEDKRFEEALKEQLEEKDKIIGNLQEDIVTLRKYLQQKNM
jgi:hypothetical protein